MSNYVNPKSELTSIWIEDLEHQPSSTLYNTLLPLHKPSYTDNDGFVFYNFSTVQKSTLDHVVDILQYIDIPVWFVTIVTNQESTKHYFKSLADPIRVIWQDEPIDHEVIRETIPLFNTNHQMCAHAWAGIHVLPNGSTKLCCDFLPTLRKSDSTEFNIRQHTLEEIVNSDHVKALREEFRQGKVPSGCMKCVNIESSGGNSRRQLARFKLKNIWGHIDWESDSISNIGFMGGHLGNLCNLKCRICDEKYSSSIAMEKIANGTTDRKQNPSYLTILNNNWKHHSKIFFDSIKKMPQLRNFEFLGGEPLLVKENIEFMKYLVDNNLSQDCIFEFVTNGTQYLDVFDCAQQFKRLTITLSIDDIGSRFEYQRSGAKWKLIESNLKKFMSNAGLTVGVSITVSIQNVLYLPELIQWLLSHGIEEYSCRPLHFPEWLSIKNLTPEAKILVIDKLSNSGLKGIHQDRLNFIVEEIRSSTTQNNGLAFIENIRRIDSIRGENFASIHPEIAKAMGFI